MTSSPYNSTGTTLAMKSLVLVLMLSLLRHTFWSLRYATWALAFLASMAVLLGCNQEICDPRYLSFFAVNYWIAINVVDVTWEGLRVCEEFGFGEVEGEAIK